MNNVNIEIGNKSFQRELPSCFQELNRSQLLAVSPYVLFNTNNIKIRREIAVLFLDLPERILDMMNLSQFDEIANTFNFLWTINDLTNQLIPIAKSSLFLTLHGPSSLLENICAAEFAFADKYAMKFSVNKDEKDLDLFIGSLYRPAAKRKQQRKHDKRIAFDVNTLNNNAALASKLPLDVKLAIFVFYQGCRSYISKRYNTIFTNNTKNVSKKNSSGWLDFFYNIAGPKTGTFHEVAKMNIYELLSILETIIKQNKIQKEKMEAISKKQRNASRSKR